ncbi:hypothetical protein ZWY2020_006282 [Hordeum vulgare]|nr:hypothetical protein ZWY2020_006282 [Hordeum vulgare]
MANSHESPRRTDQNKHEVGETSGAVSPLRFATATRRVSPRRFATATREQRGGVPHLPQLAAAKIADSLEPTDSEAGIGIEQIRALLHTVQQQNSAVSQSHNRIHNSSVHANTHRSVFSPDSHQRHRGGSCSMNPEDRRRSRTPPRGGPYGP